MAGLLEKLVTLDDNMGIRLMQNFNAALTLLSGLRGKERGERQAIT